MATSWRKRLPRVRFCQTMELDFGSFHYQPSLCSKKKKKNRILQPSCARIHSCCEEKKGVRVVHDQIPVCSAVICLPLVSGKSGSLTLISACNTFFHSLKRRCARTDWKPRICFILSIKYFFCSTTELPRSSLMTLRSRSQ